MKNKIVEYAAVSYLVAMSAPLISSSCREASDGCEAGRVAEMGRRSKLDPERTRRRGLRR